MGHFISNIQIADITEPKTVTLSGNPNFITFERNDGKEDKPVNFKVTVKGNSGVSDMNLTKIDFHERDSKIIHTFIGTTNPEDVNSTTFLLGKDSSICAENLKRCLIANSFFRSNYDITLPPVIADGKPANSSTIYFTSKGSGWRYALSINWNPHPIYGFMNFYDIPNAPATAETSSYDSIDKGTGKCEIEIDTYADTGVFLGKEELPDKDTLGKYRTTVSKKYFGQPLWFDVNILRDDRDKYSDNFLHRRGWCDAGTVSDYRFVARRYGQTREGNNVIVQKNEIFYISDVLYSLTGYKRDLESNDLSAYVYDTVKNNTIKPLTNQPALTHAKGQKQYFNFILSDPGHDKDNVQMSDYKLGILFELYTQSGHLIDSIPAHSQSHNAFDIVNTVELDIDHVIRNHQNVGIVKAHLCRDNNKVSEPLEFHILPECLYDTRDFAFLNSLGGWSSFNFPSTKQGNFKTKANSYYITQTPQSRISSEMESVQYKEVEEEFIVKTMPITEEVAEWLKEMSTSVAIYEISTKRYVIVDDFTLKYTSEEDLFQYEMKYHYSDSYNAK